MQAKWLFLKIVKKRKIKDAKRSFQNRYKQGLCRLV